jgi:23S rRNA (pseudouridine1915-N3)-methyltransferase
MKISLLAIQKTTGQHYPPLIDDYVKRLGRYITFKYIEIPVTTANKMDPEEVKEKEGLQLLKQLKETDQLWLLDEKGLRMSSSGLARFISGKQDENCKHIVFAIGGPYGFSPDVKSRSKGSISMSDMTFTHQMIRLFFAEQLYRAFTILNNEPYHHE